MAQPQGTEMSDEDGFVDRWSRRKRAAERPAASIEPVDAVEKPVDTASEAPPVEPISDEERAALPRIEALAPGSDIRAFLRPGVPKALKNAAMRKMWMLTPAIRDHDDPAVDYAWDWNTPGGVPGSGGAVSGESLAKQLKALRQTPVEADEPTTETETEIATTGETTQPAEPVVAPDDVAPEPEKEPASTRIRNADSEGLPAPRRHGGAMPT